MMAKASDAVRTFVRNLGPVEQAQVVSSTAVIVSMSTIVAAIILTGQEPRLMDFISVLTIGLIGYLSVYFSLTYGRQLDEQRRQLLALNTIAEAVNSVVTLDSVLRTALTKTADLLNTPYGWIYMLDGDRLVLNCVKGTTVDFLALRGSDGTSSTTWLHQPRVERERVDERTGHIHPELKRLGIQFWASIPLRSKDTAVGTVIVAGSAFEMFASKEAELMEAFGNQISVAVSNAQLFERVTQSEKRYADLYEHAPDIYLHVNRDHVIAGCNRTGADMLGYPREKIIGRPFEDLFLEERRAAIREVLMRMFNERGVLKDMEEQFLMSNGKALYVNMNSSLLRDDQDRTVSARIVARDITERKKMESAILHAQKIDSIGNLAGGIAHDFNNILASILGSASIMRRRMTEEEKLYKYVQIIEGAARRGSSLTRQLLTFARKTETFTKPVDVNALVHDTLQLFERSVSKEIVLQTNFTGESALVNGDEGQLQQAVLNLLLNARDAMPGGGTITVSTTCTVADAHTTRQFASVKPGAFVTVTVADSGVGMEKTVQNRIFEPFFTTKDHGTGLGLSVTYGVVQNHGGFINLESEPGQGTIFTLFFPRSDQRLRSARQERQQHLPRGIEHILIIEDEESVREIARDMLTELGYTILVAPDGRTGVETYRSRQASVDLILLDMNMPLMGGREAYEQLKKINPGLRIIILTGYGRGVIEPSSFPGEVNGFLQKPFHLEDLALKVRKALDTRTVEPTLP
jgi:PAS domain S-box-containing protein